MKLILEWLRNVSMYSVSIKGIKWVWFFFIMFFSRVLFIIIFLGVGCWVV